DGDMTGTGHRVRPVAPSSDGTVDSVGRRAQDADTAVFKATLLKVFRALEPMVVMAAMQTTMIRASITAYSTAVGPSSSFRKRSTLVNHFLMAIPFRISFDGTEPCEGVRRSHATSSDLGGR